MKSVDDDYIVNDDSKRKRRKIRNITDVLAIKIPKDVIREYNGEVQKIIHNDIPKTMLSKNSSRSLYDAILLPFILLFFGIQKKLSNNLDIEDCYLELLEELYVYFIFKYSHDDTTVEEQKAVLEIYKVCMASFFSEFEDPNLANGPFLESCGQIFLRMMENGNLLYIYKQDIHLMELVMTNSRKNLSIQNIKKK